MKYNNIIYIVFLIIILSLDAYFGYLAIWKKQHEFVPVLIFLGLIVLFVVVFLKRK